MRMVRVVGMGSVPRAIPECLNKVSLSSRVMIWSPRVWWLHKSRLSRIRPFLTAEEHLGGERWPGEEIARVNTMETGSKCTGEKPTLWGGMGSKGPRPQVTPPNPEKEGKVRVSLLAGSHPTLNHLAFPPTTVREGH